MTYEEEQRESHLAKYPSCKRCSGMKTEWVDKCFQCGAVGEWNPPKNK